MTQIIFLYRIGFGFAFRIFIRIAVEESSLTWLAEICDGDARIALNSLQLAIESLQENTESIVGLKMMPLSAIQDGIKVISEHH